VVISPRLAGKGLSPRQTPVLFPAKQPYPQCPAGLHLVFPDVSGAVGNTLRQRPLLGEMTRPRWRSGVRATACSLAPRMRCSAASKDMPGEMPSATWRASQAVRACACSASTWGARACRWANTCCIVGVTSNHA
jgi:hypothetical protein